MNTVVIKDVDLKQLSKDVDELNNDVFDDADVDNVKFEAFNNIMNMLKQWNTDYKGIYETR